MTQARARIGTWLNDLAALTAGNMPLPEVKTRVAALASVLEHDFPPEAFTPASLRGIAQECKFFPAYAELHAALAARRPKPAPGADALALGDRHAVETWAACGLDERLPRLAVIRRYQPAAFAHLLRTHDGALRIAQAQGWTPAASLSEAERQAIAAGLRATAQALRAAVPA